MAKIEAVIFDWGGVLIEDPAPGLMQYCADALNISANQYAAAHGLFQEDFQKGLIAEEVFWERVCNHLGRPMPNAQSLWGNAFRAVYKPRAEMFELASVLKQKDYKTGFLSNTESAAMEFFHTLGYDMFDALTFSCAEHTKKPERKIYELTVEKLGVVPSASVFIDDSPVYIEGAKQAGLNTILFTNIPEVKNKLNEIGISVD